MDSQIEEIKNKLNITDVVGSYIKLQKTGTNWRGPCPFHSEKKPSFFVSPGRQIFKCFGCGVAGSIFDFVMKIEGIEFGDALRMLANKAGVELKRENPQLRSERQRLYEICEISCKFFEKQLEASAIGKEAKNYLLKRGISEQSIKKWRLGYSPDTWQGLSDFLIGKGYKRNEIILAGLAVAKEGRNDSYDRFRGRIVFPVFDINSQPVGFGARVFKVANEKETAKYINTPATLLYDKSNILFALNNAKLAIRKANLCVVVEGYTDAILCHQAGYENTVAASGTALTARHLDLLKRYSENLLLAFDMDVAGDSATKRGINLAQEKGFNIKIVEKYAGAKDPADIILENPENWKTFLEKARSIMDYYFDSAFSNFDKNSPEGKKQIGRVILPAIKRLQNKIEQSFWVQKLASKLDIKEEAVIEELNNTKVDTVILGLTQNPETRQGAHTLDSGFRQNGANGNSRKKLLEEKIIALVLKDPENLNLIKEKHCPLFSEDNSKFLQALKNNDSNNPEIKEFRDELALRAEVEYKDDGEDEILLCLLQLKNLKLKERLDEISKQIKQAEEEKDSKKTAELTQEFHKLTKEL